MTTGSEASMQAQPLQRREALFDSFPAYALRYVDHNACRPIGRPPCFPYSGEDCREYHIQYLWLDSLSHLEFRSSSSSSLRTRPIRQSFRSLLRQTTQFLRRSLQCRWIGTLK